MDAPVKPSYRPAGDRMKSSRPTGLAVERISLHGAAIQTTAHRIRSLSTRSRRSRRYRGQHVGNTHASPHHRVDNRNLPCRSDPSSPHGGCRFAQHSVLIRFRSTWTRPRRQVNDMPHPPAAAGVDQYFTHAQIKFPLDGELRSVKIRRRDGKGNAPGRHVTGHVTMTDAVAQPRVLDRNYAAFGTGKDVSASEQIGLADVRGTYIIEDNWTS